MTTVIDSSALLAVLRGERGWEVALPHIRGARMSAVNYSETLAKVGDKELDENEIKVLIDSLEVNVVAFDRIYADAAARLRPQTRGKDISFADRACLAQGVIDGLPIIAADRAWSALNLNLEIIQIR